MSSRRAAGGATLPGRPSALFFALSSLTAGLFLLLLVVYPERRYHGDPIATWHRDYESGRGKIEWNRHDAEAHHRKLLRARRSLLPSSDVRKRCEQVLLDGVADGVEFTHVDAFVFHNLFKPLIVPGIYVQIGRREPTTSGGGEGSNTAFFDVCLGWKGVLVTIQDDDKDVSRDHRLRSYRKMKVITSTSTKRSGGTSSARNQSEIAPFVSLQAIFRDNVEVLGDFGMKPGYVAVDLEGEELVRMVGCGHIVPLTREPYFQVWSIRTDRLTAQQLRLVDAAMLLGGYAKITSILGVDQRFNEDVYVLAPNAKNLVARTLPQHRCNNGAVCSLASVLKQSSDSSLSKLINCQAN